MRLSSRNSQIPVVASRAANPYCVGCGQALAGTGGITCRGVRCRLTGTSDGLSTCGWRRLSCSTPAEWRIGTRGPSAGAHATRPDGAVGHASGRSRGRHARGADGAGFSNTNTGKRTVGGPLQAQPGSGPAAAADHRLPPTWHEHADLAATLDVRQHRSGGRSGIPIRVGRHRGHRQRRLGVGPQQLRADRRQEHVKPGASRSSQRIHERGGCRRWWLPQCCGQRRRHSLGVGAERRGRAGERNVRRQYSAGPGRRPCRGNSGRRRWISQPCVEERWHRLGLGLQGDHA